MKKLLAVLIAIFMACCIFAGCARTPAQSTTPENGNNSSSDATPETTIPDKETITKMYITVNGNKLEVALEQNSATAALLEILKEGDLTYTADDYGNFEKVGSIGQSLPTSDKRMTAQAGDVMLYLGSNIVIFYGSNSWEYTKLGKIKGYSPAELKKLLGSGSVQITLSLK